MKASSQLIVSHVNEPIHFVYLDNGVFRRLKRNPIFFNNFVEQLDMKFPHVFWDFQFIFTWSQLIEDLDLGKILHKVENAELWKKRIAKKTIFKKDNHAAALNYYFFIIRNIIANLPELQKNFLLQKLAKSLQVSHSEADLLVNASIIKARSIIKEGKYLSELSYELAWAFITSYPLIITNEQWIQRKTYLESLFNLWHQFYSEKREFNLYRLAERYYHSYAKYNLQLNYEAHKDKFLLLESIKHASDLCDGELIFYILLGILYKNDRLKVIGITFDDEIEVRKRIAIFRQTLIALNRDVKDWNFQQLSGEIFCIIKDKNDETKIIDIKHIKID